MSRDQTDIEKREIGQLLYDVLNNAADYIPDRAESMLKILDWSIHQGLIVVEDKDKCLKDFAMRFETPSQRRNREKAEHEARFEKHTIEYIKNFILKHLKSSDFTGDRTAFVAKIMKYLNILKIAIDALNVPYKLWEYPTPRVKEKDLVFEWENSICLIFDQKEDIATVKITPRKSNNMETYQIRTDRIFDRFIEDLNSLFNLTGKFPPENYSWRIDHVKYAKM